MKKLFNVFIGVLLISSLLPFADGSAASPDTSTEVDTLISELIYYYGEGARTDVLRTLDLIEEESPEDDALWRSVIEQWDFIENDMVENLHVAPDGLPEDDTHAFIVLGFALKDDGTMEDELIGRLEVALNSAEKYPDSYVLVTGGVERNGWTEGDRMRDWLVDQGLSEDRIIVENESSNTVENASFSFDYLYNDYDIDTVSIISSQYHLKRASIFYYTMSLLKADEYETEPITFLAEGNAGWLREDLREESMELKVNGMYSIAGVEASNDLPISQLEELMVEGDLEYHLFDRLDLEVYAAYDSDYVRDVTELAEMSAFDATVPGEQEIEFSYEENGVRLNENITVRVLDEEVSAPLMNRAVSYLAGDGQFANEETVRALDIHLTAVGQFELQEEAAKVIRHMGGFQDLLHAQLDKGLITEEAYELLKTQSDALVEKWQ
jgi:vancomycin permeability regulator SanA